MATSRFAKSMAGAMFKTGDGYLDLNLKDGGYYQGSMSGRNWRESFNKDIKIENVEGK